MIRYKVGGTWNVHCYYQQYCQLTLLFVDGHQLDVDV